MTDAAPSLFEVLPGAIARERQAWSAAALRAAGCVPGDRVAIVAHNAADVICLAVGALRSGVIPVMVNPDLTVGERAVILADAQAAVEVGDHNLRAFIDSGADAPSVDLADVPLGRPMHYTSGTTGRPKGVWSGLLEERDGAALLTEEREQWGFVSDDINLVCSPLYHSAPLRFATGTLLAGGDVVVLHKFSPEAALGALAAHPVTNAFMAPAHLQRLFELPPEAMPDLSTFRLLAHAGAPCPEPVKRRAIEVFPPDTVWEFYGATEGQFTVSSPADHQARPGSVGRTRNRRRMWTAPRSLDGSETSDEASVLWCETPSYARFSYWNDPEKTAAVWNESSFTVFDLGRVDDDGFVYLDGRRDDLLITGGVNVYPLEVEIALHRLPGVDEVAVFGLDDERWGQRLCAAVVRKADPVGSALTEQALRSHAESVLAPYKRPKQYWFVDAIPHTPTGKVRRSRLGVDLGVV